MYLEYFLRAREHLSQHGWQPRVVMGKPVSESDLKAVDAEIGVPMPSELRQFYLELGDAFHFITDESGKYPRYGWGHMHLGDHVGCNKNFRREVETAAVHLFMDNKFPEADESGKLPPITGKDFYMETALLKQEMERRFSWVPFWGFGGGGPYLCLDLHTEPPVVRAYTDRFWVTSPKTWDFVVARSFTEFVEKWSRFHFLEPHGVDWPWIFDFQEGTFDWSPEHFQKVSTSP